MCYKNIGFTYVRFLYKFYNEENNMLENDPEIRDSSLRRKASWLEKMRWSRWYKGGTTVVKIAIPTAIAIATLTACTPKVDEQQQKAYKNYLSAWGEYQTAVSTYDKLETPGKPSLPSKLVIANDLDDKATTEALNSKTTTLQNATTEINQLCEALKNNETQKVAYQSYLSAWGTYANAVAEYEALENAEKPALPANLLLTKDLDEKATTKALNDARTALENATAEINKLIKQYEQETPTPPEPPIDYDKLTPADLTDEQKNAIITSIITALEKNIKQNIGRGDGVINEILGFEFKNNTITLLLDYTNSTFGNMIGMYRYTMVDEVNYKALIVDGVTPVSATAKGEKIIEFSSKSNDDRMQEVLAKLNPTLAETNPQFVSLTKISGAIIDNLGKTNEIKLFVINDDGITIIKTNARSDGDRTDPIGQSILAESAEIGKDYTKPTTETYEFGENVILLGEMFKEDDSNEVLDAFEHKGQTYAIIRNRYTELKKGAESENY